MEDVADRLCCNPVAIGAIAKDGDGGSGADRSEVSCEDG
jgi:hypothetical protein